MSAHRKYTEELLIDYVEGLLTSEQRIKLESILEQDEYARSMVDGIRLWFQKHGDDREGLEAWLDAEMPSKNQQPLHRKKGRVLPMRQVITWVAAAILLIAIVPTWFMLRSPDYSELLADYSQSTYEYPHAVRDSEAASDQAFASYDDGDYQLAAILFEESLKQDPENDLLKFMLGLSFFNSGEFKSGSQYLVEVAQSESRFAQQASWYYALACLQLEDYKEGTRVLQEIVRLETYRYEEAQLLLSQVVPNDHDSPD